MEAITSNIPREVEDILVDIKYMAGLPPGKKYDIGTKTYVSATNFFTQRRRDWVEESHIKTLDFLNTTIDIAIKACKKYPRWKELVCREISLTSDALTNIKHVYNNKPFFQGKIDVVILRINPSSFYNACVSSEIIFVEQPIPDI